MSLLVPLSFIVVAGINSGIGAYVLFYQLRGKPNRAFFVFSIGASAWIGGFGLLLATHQHIFIPVLLLGCTVMLLGLFWLAQVFPAPAPDRDLSMLWYLPFILGAYASLYPGAMIRQVIFAGSGAIPTQGPWFPYYALGFAAYTLFTVALLFTTYRKSATPERTRFQYFFLGTGLFVLATMLCDVVLPALGIFSLNFIGPLSSVVSLAATAYAIIRHELMDIRIVIQRSLVYSLLLGLIVSLYAVIITSISFFFQASGDAKAIIAGGITMIAGIFGAPLVERHFRKITDPIFFKDTYVYSAALEDLSTILNTNLNFRQLITQSMRELDRILRPSYIYFFHTDSDSWFSMSGRIRRSIGRRLERSDSRDTRVPVSSSEKMLGEFVLGPKRSGDPFTSEDQALLRTFAGQATVALQKAELYQELKEHTNKLEQKVEERTQHLRQMQDQQREFFDDMSHALQTPLTVLKSAVELLASGKAEHGTKVYKSMERGVDDLSRLIRNMLELSRIGTSSAEAAFETFDFSACVSRIVEYVGTVAHEQDIALTSSIEPGLLVHGDPKQIDEAVTNLLGNAVRYTKGCPRRLIQVSLSAGADTITLVIQDSGIGIAPEQLPLLFERFYRTEGGRERTKGFGLGLAIAKRIIASHEGSIDLKSGLGEGTTVTVRFPRP